MKKILSVILSIFIIASMNICACAESDELCYLEISDDGDYVFVSFCQDLSHIAEEYDLSKVDHICLDSCTVRKNEKIIDTPGLRTIILENCNFADNKVNFPETIEKIYFEGTIPEDLSTLKKCKNISSLNVDGCKLKNLRSFSNIGTVESVSFNYCDIDSISGIEKGNTIENLGFCNVQIESIEELRNLKGLRYLDLDQTAVRDLSPIKDLDLYDISLTDNHLIENIEVVMEIDTLTSLYGLNCQLLFTPEIVDFIEKNDLYSHYEKGDLELREKVIAKCDEIENKYPTDEERIGATVKYVCDLVTYDFNVYADEDLLMEYGNYVLKNAFKGTGCCTTYSGLVAMMLNNMGIDCYCVSNEDHIWNIVELDGYHYYLDATWIDSEYDIEYLDESRYFMVTDDEFAEEHCPESMPAAVRNNPESFNGTFECSTRFRIREENDYEYSYDEEEIEEEITSAETATTEEKTTMKETETQKVKETETAETTAKEKTTDKKENPQKEMSAEDNNKTIIIISISAASVAAIMVALIIIMKKRKNPAKVESRTEI